MALFAEKDILENRLPGEFGILKGGSWRFLGVQVLAIIAVASWAAITTFLELLLVDKLVGMRMTLQEELLGADIVEHGIIEREESQAVYAWGKVNGQTNSSGLENIAYQTERDVECPQTAPRPPISCSLQVRPVNLVTCDMTSNQQAENLHAHDTALPPS